MAQRTLGQKQRVIGGLLLWRFQLQWLFRSIRLRSAVVGFWLRCIGLRHGCGWQLFGYPFWLLRSRSRDRLWRGRRHFVEHARIDVHGRRPGTRRWLKLIERARRKQDGHLTAREFILFAGALVRRKNFRFKNNQRDEQHVRRERSDRLDQLGFVLLWRRLFVEKVDLAGHENVGLH